MPEAEEMRASMRCYLDAVCRHDVDAVLALLSENVSVEDPVGGPPGTHVIGREAVESFFRKGFAMSRPSPRLTGPIRTTGAREAAMPFVLRLELRGQLMELDVIDVVRFDDSGSIESLRAFWNFGDARVVEAGG